MVGKREIKRLKNTFWPKYIGSFKLGIGRLSIQMEYY